MAYVPGPLPSQGKLMWLYCKVMPFSMMLPSGKHSVFVMVALYNAIVFLFLKIKPKKNNC